MVALRLVSAIQGQVSNSKLLKKELLFVDVTLNGRATRALVDTRATHNFIAKAEAKRLGLNLEKDMSKIKIVNSVFAGVAKRVMITIGPWTGAANFTAATINDFKVILNIDFLVSSKTIPMLNLEALSIMEEMTPCMVLTSRGEPAVTRTLSALQLWKRVKHGEVTYLAAIRGGERRGPRGGGPSSED